MDRQLFNRILLAMIFVESVFVSGVIGYQVGVGETVEQPIYNFTIRVDPSMIEYKETVAPVPEPASEPELAVEQEVELAIASQPEPIPVTDIYTEKEINYIAKTVWGEARGLNDTHRSAVIWTILNRLDNGGFGKNIVSVITAPKQFIGYRSSNPVTEDIRNLVIDVLERYEREKAGETDVGRTLPKEYIYFTGNGKENRFVAKWKSKKYWDWSLESPYV